MSDMKAPTCGTTAVPNCAVVGSPGGRRARIRRSGTVRVLGGVAALAALVAVTWLGQGGAAVPAVTFRATEFLYKPGEGTAHAGEVVFVVRNEGAIEHNFVIQNAAKKNVAEIAVIEPGTSTEVRAAVAAGTYTIFCSLPGHREAGMVATLVVAP